MLRGSCLCGGVAFELASVSGPFELCHCNRCRKVSGSAFVAAVGVKSEDYRLVRGAELITRFELPVRDVPPAYGYTFCRRCGCTVPPAEPEGPWFEIAAGLLDDEPDLTPDRHIFVEHAPRWAPIADGLPQLDAGALARLREDKD
ncbi:MAG: GFA family protein [Myxococcales bacterium]|nr:GFA family protein [Myxococcales bacterium]